MAYKFEPVINPYVDPGSVKVSEILNERFSQNFAAADALSTALRDMQYAPFENDTKIATELQKNATSQLEEFADRGDYENLSFGIHSAAKKFADTYKPIQTNYDQVTKYKTEIEDLYKTGKIDANTMNKAFKYSAHNYKGVKIDPNTGYVDPNSYFKGVDVVQDPNILQMVTQGIADIMASGNTSKVKRVGQGPEAQYEVLTENGWEGVSADKVASIVQTILNQPNVQAFLNQEAEFSTFDIDDQSLQNWANSTITDYQNKILQIKNSGYNSKTKNNAINSLNSELQLLQKGLQDPTILRNYLKQQHINSRVKEFEDYAIAKKAYSKTTSSYVQDWDAKYLKDYENYLKNLPEVVVAGQVHEVPNIGGNTVKSINSNINDITNRIEELSQKIYTGVYSNEQVEIMQNEIKDLDTRRKLQQTRLEHAAEASGQDLNAINENKDKLKNNFLNLLTDNKVSKFNKDENVDIGIVYKDPKTKDDFFQFPWESTDQSVPFSWLAETYANSDFDFNKTLEAAKNKIAESTGQNPKDIEINLNVANDLQYSLEALAKDANYFEYQPNEDKINKFLKTTQKPSVSFTNVMPGFTPSQRVANTKAINEFFKAGIPSHLHAFTSGEGADQGLTSMQSLIDNGIIGSDYKVIGQVLINNQSSNTGGVGDDLYAIQVEYGEKDKPTKKTIFVPVNEANIASQSAVLNHPINKWNRIVMAASNTAFTSDNEYVHEGFAKTSTGDHSIEYHINPMAKTVKVKFDGQWVSNEYGPINYGVGDQEFLNNFVSKPGIITF